MRGARLVSCSRPWCQSPPAASNYAQESLDRYFRIEYQVEPSVARPVVSGYVDNMHPGLPADRMQLAIEALDASGKVVGTSSPGYLAVYQPAIAATSARWSCRPRRIGSRYSSSTEARAAAATDTRGRRSATGTGVGSDTCSGGLRAETTGEVGS